MQEAALHDAGRDLGAKPAGQRRLVHDHAPSGLPDARLDRIDVEGVDGAQVDELDAAAALLDRLHALHDAGAPAHHRELRAFAHHTRLADRDRVLVLGHLLAEGPVDALGLEEDHRIGIADRADQQSLRVVGGAWHHHLDAGLVRVDRLRRVAVQLRRVDSAADGHADRHRHGELTARAGAHACGVRADLVVRGTEEAVELDLGHRAQSSHREADRGADDAALGQRRVDDAVRAKALLETLGDAEDAAIGANVLAEQDDTVVLLHLLDQGEVDGLYKREIRHGTHSVYGCPTPEKESGPAHVRRGPPGRYASCLGATHAHHQRPVHRDSPHLNP